MRTHTHKHTVSAHLVLLCCDLLYSPPAPAPLPHVLFNLLWSNTPHRKHTGNSILLTH